MTDASLLDRLAAWLRDPRMCWAYTFCALAFLYTAWGVHSQPDVYNRVLLSRAFAVGGVGLLGVRAWAGGLHRWLARVGGRGVRRARSVEIGVSGADVAIVGVAALVVVSGVVAVVAVDSGTSPVQNASAADGDVFADFEDGTVSPFSGGTATSDAITGSYSLYITNTQTASISDPTKLKARMKPGDIQSNNYAAFNLYSPSGAEAQAVARGDSWEYRDGSNLVDSGVPAKNNTVYVVAFTNVNMSANTYDLTIAHNNGTTILDKNGLSVWNQGSSIDEVQLSINSANGTYDDFYTNFDTISYGSSSTASSDTYEQTFQLVDYTGEFPDPTLTVEQYNGEETKTVDGTTGTAISETDWLTVEETTFNHNDRATVDMEETARHRLTLTDGDATYQEIGFKPSEKPNPYNLTIGTPGTPTPTANATTTATPANTSDEACAFVQADDGDYELVCNFDDEVTSYEFNLSAPNGSYYDGELDFDEPTSYYQGEFDRNFTSNLTDGESVDPEDLAIDYSGTYANGTSFNGTTSLFGTSDGGGGFSFGGPTGKSGGGSSGLQQAGGIALLGGVAILGYRRFSDQSLTETASSAASVASSAAGRVASAASGVVGRLRGGGRG